MNKNQSELLALKPGDVVQLNPEKIGNKAFTACFMVIDEVHEWGIQGYIQTVGTREESGGQAYYRAKWEEFEYIGRALWVVS